MLAEKIVVTDGVVNPDLLIVSAVSVSTAADKIVLFTVAVAAFADVASAATTTLVVANVAELFTGSVAVVVVVVVVDDDAATLSDADVIVVGDITALATVEVVGENNVAITSTKVINSEVAVDAVSGLVVVSTPGKKMFTF